MKHWKRISVVALLAVVAVVIVLFSSGRSSRPATQGQSYEFASIDRGAIESVVTSSGTLSVVSQVEVLAQMSGRLESVKVDYNDEVRVGQILATVNTDLLALQARAARANVDKARASYELQALAAQNARALFDKQLLSDYDLRSALSALDVKKAELSAAEASLEQVETEMREYAIIRSPIDGIVLKRAVEAGQGVISGSSSATSLFTIAEDLSSMRIEASVDELDIGSISVGQAVRFSVEADSTGSYEGSVRQIRLLPETSGNVVYYSVIILADNPRGKLLPGMTANVEFIKEKKDNVLRVPSAALRFTPSTLSSDEVQRAVFEAGLSGMSDEQKAQALTRFDEMRKSATAGTAGTATAGGLSSLMSGVPSGAPGGGMPGGGMPGSGSGSGRMGMGTGQRAAATANKKTLWYLDDAGKLAVMLVDVGASDESRTEISGADGLEGLKVIVKVQVK